MRMIDSIFFFFSSRRRHTRFDCDWSSDVCSSDLFPEGAVLNLRFRLARSDFVVNTRCEVRYCLPGVGIGVEFVQIPPEAVRAIEREIHIANRPLVQKS